MNGSDINWDRVCAAIDGFRVLHGRWPKRVRVMPISFDNLVAHVLTPMGFALVSSYVELVPEDGAVVAVADAPGGRYSVPSRNDCLACHEGPAVPVLGFSALQLSPDRDPLAF